MSFSMKRMICSTVFTLVVVTASQPCRFSASQEKSTSMQTTPAIKVDVNLIALTATVVGRKDQFVPDLQKEDFVVSEDGVPQEIAVFQKEEVPARVGIDFDTSGSMVVLRNNLIVSLPRTQSDFGQTQLS